MRVTGSDQNGEQRRGDPIQHVFDFAVGTLGIVEFQVGIRNIQGEHVIFWAEEVEVLIKDLANRFRLLNFWRSTHL